MLSFFKSLEIADGLVGEGLNNYDFKFTIFIFLILCYSLYKILKSGLLGNITEFIRTKKGSKFISVPSMKNNVKSNLYDFIIYFREKFVMNITKFYTENFEKLIKDFISENKYIINKKNKDINIINIKTIKDILLKLRLDDVNDIDDLVFVKTINTYIYNIKILWEDDSLIKDEKIVSKEEYLDVCNRYIFPIKEKVETNLIKNLNFLIEYECYMNKKMSNEILNNFIYINKNTQFSYHYVFKEIIINNETYNNFLDKCILQLFEYTYKLYYKSNKN